MTTPLPAGLLFEDVRWTTVGISEDDEDPGADPNAEQINGVVTFVPLFQFLKFIGTEDNPNPVTVLPRPETYTLANGKLIDSEGREGARLLANNTPGTSPQGWQYRVSYELDGGYAFGSFVFSLEAGTPVDLTLVIPETLETGEVYLTGPPGPAATVDVGTVTTLAPGSAAAVVNEGNSSHAILSFGLPAGQDGTDGVDGTDGEMFGGGFVVEPFDPDDPLVVSISSRWGIDSGGNAYFDPDGAAPGEAALLIPDVASGEFYLFQPGTTNIVPVNPHTHVSADITDAADESAIPGTLVKRTAGGSGVFDSVYANRVFGYDNTAPTDPAQLTRKDYVDTAIAGRATPADITTASTADRARANHTGTQPSTTISDFTEAVQDAVAALLGAGSNVILNYDDTAGTLTVSATGSGGTGLDAEQVRDTIGVALVGAGVISVTVNDAADTITISSVATQNATDAALRDRSTHTGTQSADTITDGTTNKAYTATEKTKLAGVATGATANATDAQLRDRTTHTGAQDISTVTGLQTALDGKITAFADPNADRLVFWDDSASAFAALTPGTGLSVTGTTIDVATATATAAGIVELATTAETTTGTDTVRAVTPAGVKAYSDADKALQEVIQAWTGSAWPTRLTGYARVRWTGGTAASAPPAVAGDVWERDA